MKHIPLEEGVVFRFAIKDVQEVPEQDVTLCHVLCHVSNGMYFVMPFAAGMHFKWWLERVPERCYFGGPTQRCKLQVEKCNEHKLKRSFNDCSGRHIVIIRDLDEYRVMDDQIYEELLPAITVPDLDWRSYHRQEREILLEHGKRIRP